MSSEGMWQLAKAYGHHMKTCIDAGQILALGMIIEQIFKKIFGPPSFDELPTLSISSGGVLPFHEQYGRWELIGVIPFANMVRGLTPYITIQTVNGILTILCVGNDPIIPLSTVEKLLDSTMQKLTGGRKVLTQNVQAKTII
jgi:hypothetical protein